MVRKIGKKIVDAAVSGPGVTQAPPPEVVHMHERLERPPALTGTTYKIQTPLSEHSLYVTINDIILNEGTEHELRRPFEIFINSKNMDHFQWIVALTRLMSAVFRKGGDVTFLAEELQAVFDPRIPSLSKWGEVEKPVIAFSTRNAVIPLDPASGSVLA